MKPLPRLLKEAIFAILVFLAKYRLSQQAFSVVLVLSNNPEQYFSTLAT